MRRQAAAVKAGASSRTPYTLHEIIRGFAITSKIKNKKIEKTLRMSMDSADN